jgi:adenosylhomocysteine nucleosidase
MVETGIGQKRTETALEWVLGQPLLGNLPYQPRVVLSTGFSGALGDDRQVGDVVLATEVTNAEGKVWPVTWPAELPPGEWRPPLHRGRILTTAKLVATPEEKRALGQQHEAVAVDLETAAVARLCTRRGVPFGCVRVISDDCRMPLSPRLVSLLSGNQVSPVRLLGALLRAPGLSTEFWRLAKQTRHAARQLGTALGELLTLTLPFGSEL